MSFLYDVLGIPITLDEIADKIARYCDGRVDVYLSHIVKPTLGYILFKNNRNLYFSMEYGTRFDGFRQMIERSSCIIREDNTMDLLGATQQRYDFILRAMNFSNKLKNAGLDVTINYESIERIMHKANFLAARINDLKETHLQ